MSESEWVLTRAFTRGKNRDASLSEDSFLTRPTFAVIDGATDKSGLKYELKDGSIVSAAKFASSTIQDSLSRLAVGTEAEESIKIISSELNEATLAQYPSIAINNRPSASIVVFDPTLKEIYSVGDCLYGFIYEDEGVIEFQNHWEPDRLLHAIRKKVITARQLSESPWDPQSSEPDPGRQVILPILTIQGLWANSDEPFGYGVINGLPVPSQYIRTQRVSKSCREVVLASDGYPHLIVNHKIDFIESEKNLAHLLTIDPLCINELKGNKGLVKDNLSHDDRTWLQIVRKV